MTDAQKIEFLVIALRAVYAVLTNKDRTHDYARTVAASVAKIALLKMDVKP